MSGVKSRGVKELQNPCQSSFLFPSNPLLLQPLKAHVVKLVDTSDLGSDAARCGGSSPSMGTQQLIICQSKIENNGRS